MKTIVLDKPGELRPCDPPAPRDGMRDRPWIIHRAAAADTMVQLMPEWESPGSGLLKTMVQF